MVFNGLGASAIKFVVLYCKLGGVLNLLSRYNSYSYQIKVPKQGKLLGTGGILSKFFFHFKCKLCNIEIDLDLRACRTGKKTHSWKTACVFVFGSIVLMHAIEY